MELGCWDRHQALLPLPSVRGSHPKPQLQNQEAEGCSQDCQP